LGESLQESARGAQRGLLVILGTALFWVVALSLENKYLYS